MKRKVIATLLSFSIAAGALVGCGGSSEAATASDSAKSGAETSASVEESTVSSAAEAGSETEVSDLEGEITFVTGSSTSDAYDEIIAAFNEQYPGITVNHEVLPGASDDVKKSLMTSLAAGDSDPDVFACDIIWISQFAAAGWLLDVTEQVEAKSDEFLAGPLSTCYYEDRAYAFPDYTDVGLLYYRTDIIDTPPTTWEELVNLSKEHQGEGGTDYGYIFQMFQGEPTSCNMLEFIKQNGGSDLVDGKFAMNNENTIGALEFVNSLIDSGIAPEGVLSHKPDDSLSIFKEGKSIFMRNWTYAYASLQGEDSKVAGNVGVTTLPVGTNGTESSGTLGGWNYAINGYTDAEDASVAFVEFLAGYEAQKINTIKSSTFPTNAAVYEDEEVLAALPYLPAVRDAAENAAPRPRVRDYSTISSIFQVYFHKALTGELEYADALEQMDKELNAALEEMQ